MAAPNIVNVTNINGKTNYLTPSTANATVLVTNSAASGNVLKINQIIATNVTGNATVAATVSLYSNGAVAVGGTPAGGNAFPIASTISVPASASLIVVDKSTAIYIEEANCISVTSATANALTFSVSYEVLS